MNYDENMAAREAARPEVPNEADTVFRWRLDVGMEMGLSWREAEFLAGKPDTEADLHLLARLVKQGCDPHVAFEIVR